MPNKTKEPPLKPDPRKTPVRPDKDASPEPEHVDPPPRDVREAPAPNPNANNKPKRPAPSATCPLPDGGGLFHSGGFGKSGVPSGQARRESAKGAASRCRISALASPAVS